MVDGAIFNSHDSGSHFYKLTFKNGCCKKNYKYLGKKVEVACKLSMQSLHRHTLPMV